MVKTKSQRQKLEGPVSKKLELGQNETCDLMTFIMLHLQFNYSS